MGFNTRSASLGGSSSITLRRSTTLLDGGPVTLAMNLKQPGSPSTGVLFKKRSDGGGAGYILFASATYLQVIKEAANGTRCRVQSSDTLLTSNTWVHVAVTDDGSGMAAGIKMYLNGQPVTTSTIQDNLSGAITNSEPVTLGNTFQTLMTNAAGYARQLSDSEVASLVVTTGHPTPTDPETLSTQPDLLLQMPFGPTPDNKHTVHDQAGSNDGDVSGSITFSTDVP
jgi:hypothetical protein